MHRLPDVHISVPTVTGIEGDYVALGDSPRGRAASARSRYTGDAAHVVRLPVRGSSAKPLGGVPGA
jgi:hypothetical protein